MKKAFLLLLLLALPLLCTACIPFPTGDSAQPAATVVVITASPVVQWTLPPQDDPAYVEEPATLSSDPATWDNAVLMPFYEYKDSTHALTELHARARKITTPFGYAFYLPENYVFGEEAGGIHVSYSGTGSYYQSSAGLQIVSYPKGTDVEAKVKEWMPGLDTVYTSTEDTPDDPSISKVMHGQQMTGTGAIRTMACFLKNANSPLDSTVVALLVYNGECAEVAENLIWVAETFRLQ